MSERSHRYDLLAAITAAFVSVLALFVSAYSTYWQRQQTRAQTWPHLVAHAGGAIEKETASYALEISNSGTGPLELETLVVRVDGKPARSINELFELLATLRTEKKDSIDVSVQLFSSLSAGEKVKLIEVDDHDIARVLNADLLAGKKHISITTCYCSLLDECFESSGQTGLRAQPVARCTKDPDDIRAASPN